MAGQPKSFKSLDEAQSRIAEYFEARFDYKHLKFTAPVAINSLCIHLGITRQTLNVYSKDPEYSDTINKAKTIIEFYYESQLIENPSSCVIFALKNFDWKDKIENAHSGSISYNVGTGIVRNPNDTREDADADN